MELEQRSVSSTAAFDAAKGAVARRVRKRLADAEVVKALQGRIRAKNFTDVKAASGTHDYNVNRQITVELLMHYDWVLELERVVSGDTPGEITMPMGPSGRPWWLKRSQCDVPASSETTSFDTYCGWLTRVVADGTAAERLALVFDFYARDHGSALSWSEFELLVLHHFPRSKLFARDGPRDNEDLPLQLSASFNLMDGDGDGLVTLGEYAALWKTHADLTDGLLKVDLQTMLRHALHCDEVERGLLHPMKKSFTFVPTPHKRPFPRHPRQPPRGFSLSSSSLPKSPADNLSRSKLKSPSLASSPSRPPPPVAPSPLNKKNNHKRPPVVAAAAAENRNNNNPRKARPG